MLPADKSTADPFLVLQGMAQRFAVGPVRIKVEEEEDVEIGILAKVYFLCMPSPTSLIQFRGS